VHIKDPKESDFGVVRGRNQRMKTWEKKKTLLLDVSLSLLFMLVCFVPT